MKKTILRIITVAAVLSVLFAAASVSASAATNNGTAMFLNVYGFEGESEDTKHEKWIELLYFEHGVEQSFQNGSVDITSKGTFKPFVFKHVVGKATPKFQEACAKNSNVKVAELHFCREIGNKQEVIYKVKFEGINIVDTSVESEELPEGGYRIVETVSFVANKETWTETAVNLNNILGGNTEACYDQTKKGSMFDSSTNLALAIACTVIFVLVVVVVILAVSKKKNVAAADDAPVNPVNDKDKQDS